MTIITKALGEKKSDNLQEPLVENIVVEHDEVKKADIEAGGYPIPPPQSARYEIMSARVRGVKPYYSLMFILMLVLLIATSLLGIFGTEYLYEQYRNIMGAEVQPEVYRAFGTLSYDDEPNQMAYENKVPARFERTQEPVDMSESKFLSNVEEAIDEMKEKAKDMFFRGRSEIESPADDKPNEQYPNVLKEEFELDVEKNRYEKFNLPEKGSHRFVHDFYTNYTAIVDVESQRCFITPLDRSLILPPKSLYDLIKKMSNGYYSMDTEKVHRDMRVQERIVDTEPLGIYINKECQNFDMYKLEKVISGVVKRSVENTETYTYFDGRSIVEINIEGVAESVPRAVP